MRTITSTVLPKIPLEVVEELATIALPWITISKQKINKWQRAHWLLQASSQESSLKLKAYSSNSGHSMRMPKMCCRQSHTRGHARGHRWQRICFQQTCNKKHLVPRMGRNTQKWWEHKSPRVINCKIKLKSTQVEEGRASKYKVSTYMIRQCPIETRKRTQQDRAWSIKKQSSKLNSNTTSLRELSSKNGSNVLNSQQEHGSKTTSTTPIRSTSSWTSSSTTPIW